VTPDTNRDKTTQKLTYLTSFAVTGRGSKCYKAIRKVVGLELLYNFGLYNFFPPRAVTMAVTMGRYNGLAKTYFNQESRKCSDFFLELIIKFPVYIHLKMYPLFNGHIS